MESMKSIFSKFATSVLSDTILSPYLELHQCLVCWDFPIKITSSILGNTDKISVELNFPRSKWLVLAYYEQPDVSNDLMIPEKNDICVIFSFSVRGIFWIR